MRQYVDDGVVCCWKVYALNLFLDLGLEGWFDVHIADESDLAIFPLQHL